MAGAYRLRPPAAAASVGPALPARPAWRPYCTAARAVQGQAIGHQGWSVRGLE